MEPMDRDMQEFRAGDPLCPGCRAQNGPAARETEVTVQEPSAAPGEVEGCREPEEPPLSEAAAGEEVEAPPTAAEETAETTTETPAETVPAATGLPPRKIIAREPGKTGAAGLCGDGTGFAPRPIVAEEVEAPQGVGSWPYVGKSEAPSLPYRKIYARDPVPKGIPRHTSRAPEKGRPVHTVWNTPNAGAASGVGVPPLKNRPSYG